MRGVKTDADGDGKLKFSFPWPNQNNKKNFRNSKTSAKIRVKNQLSRDGCFSLPGGGLHTLSHINFRM